MSESPRAPGLSRSPFAGISRPTAVMSILLLVQLAIIAFVYWPASAPITTSGGPLLSPLEAATITALEIADATGQSVTLLRRQDQWVIEDTDNFPANAQKAEETLTKLLAINTNRLVTQTPASHARLQVAEQEFNRRITLTAADGVHTSVYLGVTAGGASTHVRRAGDEKVYLTNQIASWEIDPYLSGWINTTYFSIAPADIHAVRLDLPNSFLHLERDSAGEWNLVEPAEFSDRELDPTQVASLFNRFTFISIQDILGTNLPVQSRPDQWLARIELEVQPDADLRDNAGQLTPADAGSQPTSESLPTQGDVSDTSPKIVLEFGELPPPAADSENINASPLYFVKSSTSEYYVAVSSFTVETLLQFDVQELFPSSPDSADSPAEGMLEFPSLQSEENMPETLPDTEMQTAPD